MKGRKHIKGMAGRKDHRVGLGEEKKSREGRKKKRVTDSKGEKSVLVSCASTTEVMK